MFYKKYISNVHQLINSEPVRSQNPNVQIRDTHFKWGRGSTRVIASEQRERGNLKFSGYMGLPRRHQRRLLAMTFKVVGG